MLLRCIGIALLVVVAALVVLPCGAGECDSCLHGRFLGSKPLGGLGGIFTRLTTACSLPLGDSAHVVSTGSAIPAMRRPVPGTWQEITPLRI